MDGIADKDDMSTVLEHQSEQQLSMECSNPLMTSKYPRNEFDMDKAKDIVMQTLKENDRSSNNEKLLKRDLVDSNSGCSESHSSKIPISENPTTENKSLNANSPSHKASVAGPDTSKPLRKKAKLMRMERKAQKLALTNKLPDNLPKKTPRNVEKTLDTLLNEVQGNRRHKLEVNSVQKMVSICLTKQNISGKTFYFN